MESSSIMIGGGQQSSSGGGKQSITTSQTYAQKLTFHLAELKHVFNRRDDPKMTKFLAHEHLAEISKLMRVLLEKYSLLDNKELLINASNLIQAVKSYNYDNNNYSIESHQKLIEKIDSLYRSFQFNIRNCLKQEAISMASTVQSSTTTATQNFRMQPQQPQQQIYSTTRTFASTQSSSNIPEELIYAYESGLDELIKQAKSWSKYMKELVQYIEKRCQVETDYNRNVLRNAQNLQTSIDNLKKDKAFLPFDNVYNQFCLNEIRNAKICGNNFELLIKNILNPVTDFQQEFDKKIKKIKEDWSKENKQLNEALNNMKKSREIFYAKMHESNNKSKSHDNSNMEWNPEKWERDTRNEEAHANITRLTFLYDKQKNQFRSIKKDLIIRLQDLLIEIEMKIKEITSHYYETLRDSLIHSPEEISIAINDTNNYEPGKSYRDFAESLPMNHHYQQQQLQQQPKTSTSSNNYSNFYSNYENLENFDSSESDNNNSTFFINVHKQQASSSQQLQQQRKDRNILMNISSNKQYHHQQQQSQSQSQSQQQQKQQVHENFVIKTAEKKYKSIHGYYSSSNNSNSNNDQSGVGQRKNFFGVALNKLSSSAVPDIIKQCIKQIESRGSRINGIYRVSAVKSQVDNLCSTYETNPNSIDLSRISPNVIANFLKQFFRMLPEPLLTFQLYPDLIEIATKYSKNHQIEDDDEEEIINSLKRIVKRLPPVHYNTLKYLMRHLKQISKDSDINQMNPSNLGIVFGPTLLKKGDDDNAAFLYDTNHQSRIVELLILYSDQIFDLKQQQQQRTSQDSSTTDDDDDDNDSMDLTNNKNETTTINRHHLNVTTNGDTPKNNQQQQQQQRLTLAKSATCSSIRQQSNTVKHDLSQARLKFFASNNQNQPPSSTLFQHYTSTGSSSYSSSLINNNSNNNNNETIPSNKSVPSLMPSSSSNKIFKNDSTNQQIIMMSPFSQITSASSTAAAAAASASTNLLTTPGYIMKNQGGRLIRRITSSIGQQQHQPSSSQHHLISSTTKNDTKSTNNNNNNNNNNNKIYQKHNELSKSSSDIYSYKNISQQISLMPNDDHV